MPVDDLPAETLAASGTAGMPTLPAVPLEALSILDPAGDVRPLEESKREMITTPVAHYRGQMSEVARRLQIGRSTLYRKWKRSDCTAATAKPAPKALQQSDSRGKSPEGGPGRGPVPGTNQTGRVG